MQSNYQKAEKTYKYILDRSPDNTEARFYIAELYCYKLFKYDLATEEYIKLLAKTGIQNNLLVQSQKGIVYALFKIANELEKKEDFKAAIVIFTQIVQLNFNNEDVLASKSQIGKIEEDIIGRYKASVAEHDFISAAKIFYEYDYILDKYVSKNELEAKLKKEAISHVKSAQLDFGDDSSRWTINNWLDNTANALSIGVEQLGWGCSELFKNRYYKWCAQKKYNNQLVYTVEAQLMQREGYIDKCSKEEILQAGDAEFVELVLSIREARDGGDYRAFGMDWQFMPPVVFDIDLENGEIITTDIKFKRCMTYNPEGIVKHTKEGEQRAN